MKHIQYAVENQISKMADRLMAGSKLPLTALIFLDDGYHVITTEDLSGLTITQAYLADESAIAYAVVFDGAYEGTDREEKDCLTSAIVTREGQCRVEHTPYTGHGNDLKLGERQLAITDAHYLHLFDPLLAGKYDMKRIHELLDEINQSKKLEYKDFFVAQVG